MERCPLLLDIGCYHYFRPLNHPPRARYPSTPASQREKPNHCANRSPRTSHQISCKITWYRLPVDFEELHVGDANDASLVVTVRVQYRTLNPDLVCDIVELEGTLLRALERAWRVDDLPLRPGAFQSNRGILVKLRSVSIKARIK